MGADKTKFLQRFTARLHRLFVDPNRTSFPVPGIVDWDLHNSVHVRSMEGKLHLAFAKRKRGQTTGQEQDDTKRHR